MEVAVLEEMISFSFFPATIIKTKTKSEDLNQDTINYFKGRTSKDRKGMHI